ncbi:MAG: hypothetical protein ACK5XX_02100 [Holosporales bacterium]|jgi:hypothetical protein
MSINQPFNNQNKNQKSDKPAAASQKSDQSKGSQSTGSKAAAGDKPSNASKRS